MATQSGTGLLAVWTDIPAAMEEEFNAWYDTEHVPERLSVPGMLTAYRYTAVEGEPKYLALYECTDEKVLQSEAYMKILKPGSPWTRRVTPNFRNSSRCVYRQLLSIGNPPAKPANAVLTVRMNVAPADENDLNQWYNTDHLPALAGVPGVLRARRYVAVEGDSRYLALYELENPGVVNSAAWDKARNSDWTIRIRPKFRDLKRVVSVRMGA